MLDNDVEHGELCSPLLLVLPPATVVLLMYVATIPLPSHTLVALAEKTHSHLFWNAQRIYILVGVRECACTVHVMNTRSSRARPCERSIEQRNGLAWLAWLNQQSYAGMRIVQQCRSGERFNKFPSHSHFPCSLFILNCDGRCLPLRMRHINSSTLVKTKERRVALQHIHIVHETEFKVCRIFWRRHPSNRTLCSAHILNYTLSSGVMCLCRRVWATQFSFFVFCHHKSRKQCD